MKRHPRTKVQILAVGAAAVALGLTASPAQAVDLNLGNLGTVKVLDGNKVADVQVPGLNTGVSVDTSNGVSGKVSVGGSGGANVDLNLGGSGGTGTNVKVGDDSTPSQPSSPSSGPSAPSKPSSPSKPTTDKGKTTVKKVVKRVGADTAGKGKAGTSSGSGGSTTYTYLSSGSGSSAGKSAGAKSGKVAKAGTGRSTTTSTDGTDATTAGDGTNSSALSSDGDRLTDGGGHSTMFWVWLLLLAAAAGSGITFLGGRLRRRHQENLLRKRMVALGEELAGSPRRAEGLEEERGEDQEKELAGAVPGLAPPRRV